MDAASHLAKVQNIRECHYNLRSDLHRFFLNLNVKSVRIFGFVTPQQRIVICRSDGKRLNTLVHVRKPDKNQHLLPFMCVHSSSCCNFIPIVTLFLRLIKTWVRPSVLCRN